ncbi:MAG: cyclophilin-like fold protein [Emticicia sp.]
MKRIVLFSFIQLIAGLSISCKARNDVIQQFNNENNQAMKSNKINIKVGSKTFTATLLDNATSKAFIAQFPLTINMIELNNNEKYAQLPKSIPTNASVPTRIEAGDLMMYGSSTLVLFYKGFSTSYSYTKIGKIDDISGLTTALGAGDVKVSFEVAND